MIPEIKSIYLTTYPENDTQINVFDIIKLKNTFKDFSLVFINDHYALIYKNLNIIISNSGHIQLSLVTTLELLESLSLLARMANRINSILGIKNYSEKVMN